VMSRGQLSPTYAAGDLTREQIGLMMAGSHEQSAINSNLDTGA
jgi:hypothetical protein